MNCTTVKEGIDCVFMTKTGCGFNGGVCRAIVEQCQGCERTVEYAGNVYCQAFPDPEAKWRRGNCNMATHAKVAVQQSTFKLNPIKASKRSRK